MNRLRILMSAYACEPGKGSEPEVGWRWATMMAPFHDIIVLTRANNREAIEAGLQRIEGRKPDFVYFDLPKSIQLLKRKIGGGTHWYYALWQAAATRHIRRIVDSQRIDLIHHVTYVSFRHPAAVWGHGVPVIWGPIGGIESTPLRLLPWLHPRSALGELCRTLANRWQSSALSRLKSKTRSSTHVIAATAEMKTTLERYGPCSLIPAIGIEITAADIPDRNDSSEVKFLFVGRVLWWKGIEFALKAIASSNPRASLTIVGCGDFTGAAQALSRRLLVSDRVRLIGKIPYGNVQQSYQEHQVFLFPSLHDSGGFAVLEAMSYKLPVICLDAGGPALAVDRECGIKVPVTSTGEIVRSLTQAIDHYVHNPDAIIVHGRNARNRVAGRYSWPAKAEEVNQLYRNTAAERLPS